MERAAALPMISSCLSGDLSVCINAATLAVIDAGIPMRDYVCACTASYIEDSPFVGELASSIHTHTHALE